LQHLIADFAVFCRTPVSVAEFDNRDSTKTLTSRELMERGKIVAIITGAISIILALAYLLLVQLLDFRGEMIPAPVSQLPPAVDIAQIPAKFYRGTVCRASTIGDSPKFGMNN
jgi:hypothetical protein